MKQFIHNITTLVLLSTYHILVVFFPQRFSNLAICRLKIQRYVNNSDGINFSRSRIFRYEVLHVGMHVQKFLLAFLLTYTFNLVVIVIHTAIEGMNKSQHWLWNSPHLIDFLTGEIQWTQCPLQADLHSDAMATDQQGRFRSHESWGEFDPPDWAWFFR